MKLQRQEKLKPGVHLSLFITSYLPFFFIISFRQIYKYHEYLHWGGISLTSIAVFLTYFGMVCVFIVASIAGSVGLCIFLKNISKATALNGDKVQIKDIENKNSEAITYLFTYIIPFVFQDLASVPDVAAIVILLRVTYSIYINSSLLLINPTINWKYSLYQVEYRDNFVPDGLNNMKAMIITDGKYLEENDYVLIKKLGHKIYYAVGLSEEN